MMLRSVSARKNGDRLQDSLQRFVVEVPLLPLLLLVGNVLGLAASVCIPVRFK